MNGMSKIVKTIASTMLPFALIFGLYVIAHGHLTPGGGFQGGAVAASALVMLIVAFGSVWTMGKIKKKNLSILESIGALMFIILALLGLVFGVIFFDNFMANTDGFLGLFGDMVSFGDTFSNINTAGVIPLMNFAVGIKVIAGLFAIILIMAYATTFKEGVNQ